MFKLIALYTQPADKAAFEKYYADVHIPLVKKVPGLSKIVLNRGVDAPWGPAPYYLVVEMHFPDEATFKAALASPEMAVAGKDVGNFAADISKLMMARVD